MNGKRARLLAVGFVGAMLLAGCGVEGGGPGEAPLAPELETQREGLVSYSGLWRYSCKSNGNANNGREIRELTIHRNPVDANNCSAQGRVGAVSDYYNFGEPDTKLLYLCIAYGWDYFLSGDSNCEGQQMSATRAIRVASVQQSGTAPLYRCVTPSGDHFSSGDTNCEGQIALGGRNEGLLGYILP